MRRMTSRQRQDALPPARVSRRSAPRLPASFLAAAGEAATAASSLPNPCTLLTAAHAEKSLDPPKSVSVRPVHLQSSGTGTFASEACSETVGPLTVSVDVFLQDFGFGGVLHPTELHPSGIGGGVVITGTSAFLLGAPVDRCASSQGARLRGHRRQRRKPEQPDHDQPADLRAPALTRLDKPATASAREDRPRRCQPTRPPRRSHGGEEGVGSMTGSLRLLPRCAHRGGPALPARAGSGCPRRRLVRVCERRRVRHQNQRRAVLRASLQRLPDRSLLLVCAPVGGEADEGVTRDAAARRPVPLAGPARLELRGEGPHRLSRTSRRRSAAPVRRRRPRRRGRLLWQIGEEHISQ